MYLISLYFDEKTDLRMRSLMEQIAKRTGNDAMIRGKVPPHITLSAFYISGKKGTNSHISGGEGVNLCIADAERKAIDIFEAYEKDLCDSKMGVGKLTWCSVGTFLPHTIYLAPVLNEYLHELADKAYTQVNRIDGTRVHGRYRPFGCFPHSTMAKHLTPEEMKIAFSVLQEQFKMFEGETASIGLARTNPYRDICKFSLT